MSSSLIPISASIGASSFNKPILTARTSAPPLSTTSIVFSMEERQKKPQHFFTTPRVGARGRSESVDDSRTHVGHHTASSAAMDVERSARDIFRRNPSTIAEVRDDIDEGIDDSDDDGDYSITRFRKNVQVHKRVQSELLLPPKRGTDVLKGGGSCPSRRVPLLNPYSRDTSSLRAVPNTVMLDDHDGHRDDLSLHSVHSRSTQLTKDTSSLSKRPPRHSFPNLKEPKPTMSTSSHSKESGSTFKDDDNSSVDTFEHYRVLARNQVLEKQVASKNDEIEELKRKLHSIERKHEEKIASVEAQIRQSFKSEVEQMKRQYEHRHEESLRDARRDADAVHQTLEKELRQAMLAESERERQWKQVQTERMQAKEMMGELDHYKEEAKRLMVVNERMKRCCDTLENDVSLHKREQETLNTAYQAVLAEKVGYERDVADLKSQFHELIQDHEQTRAATLAEKKEMMHELKSLQKQQKKAVKYTTVLEKQQEQMDHVINEYQDKVEELSRCNEELRRENGGLKEELIQVLEAASDFQN